MQTDPQLIRGTLTTLLLETISRGPMYGYQICKTVNTRTDGFFDLREGSLYPALHKRHSISSHSAADGLLFLIALPPYWTYHLDIAALGAGCSGCCVWVATNVTFDIVGRTSEANFW